MIAASEPALRLFASAAEQLRRHGWDVQPDVEGEYFHIKLSHPLTSRSSIAFPNDDRDHKEFVESELAHREFRVIAALPDEVPHASLVGKVRVSAQANGWNNEVVSVIARVLRSETILTEEEAEWLEMAGPAWLVNG